MNVEVVNALTDNFIRIGHEFKFQSTTVLLIILVLILRPAIIEFAKSASGWFRGRGGS